MRKICIAILACGCAHSAVAASHSEWVISEASGAVQVMHAGNSRVVAKRDVLQSGDTVATGKNGRAVLVRGSEFVMVAPGSQLRLPSGDAASGGVTRLFQDFGSVVFMIKKKLTPHFEVKTPYLAAVVKGTTFTVSVSSAGASVQVLEGAVDVATSNGGARELITPGNVALVGAQNLLELQIDGANGRRIIEAPASAEPVEPQSAPPPVIATEQQSPAFVAPSEPVEIASAIQSDPVALSDVTQGLVTGTIGGSMSSDLRGVEGMNRGAAEASTSALRTTEIATASIGADAAETAAKERAAMEAQAVQQTNGAQQASKRAEQEAAAAAAEVARADLEHQSKAEAQTQALAAAAAAARNADEAKKAAEAEALKANEIVDVVARAEAIKAAERAAKEAEKAAKDAEKAQRDAEKAAEDVAKASGDKAAKEAEKAAKEAEKVAAKAAEEAAKAQEQAAKDAKKAADDAAQAAKDAEKASKDNAKEAEEAAKDLEKALKGKP